MASINAQAPVYRADIDGLRALAVLAVVIFHTFPNWLPGGFVGVDIFFVISGFLITSLILPGITRHTFSFGNFYARRIRRLFPALILVLLATLALGFFILMPRDYALLGMHTTASALFIKNIWIWHEAGYFDTEAELKPLLHLWSLAVEEQFYLLYPLLLWLCWKTKLPLRAILTLLFCVSFIYCASTMQHHPVEAFYLLPSRFWELLAGGLLATTVVGGMIRERASIFTSLALLLLAIAFAPQVDSIVGRQLLAVTATCLLILALPYTITYVKIFTHRLFVTTGLFSYPLYLWHWPLLVMGRMLHADHKLSPFNNLCILAISVMLGWLTWRFVETPIRRKLPSRRNIAVLVCGMLLLAIAGLAILFSQGWPSRYPGAVRELALYHFDEKSYAGYGRCWIDRETPSDKFSASCKGSLETPGKKPSLLVWGDSHAAHLYPAIDARYGGNHDVAEYTRSTCAPVLGAGNADCIAGNRFVLGQIRRLQPQTVLLFAFWNSYAGDWTKDTVNGQQLLETLHALRDAGVKHIVLVGPAPQWTGEVPDLVLETTLRDAPRYQIPTRLNTSFNPISEQVEQSLRQLLRDETDVLYISSLRTLCNEQGCLVRASPAADSLISYDYAHLTAAGARIVAESISLSF